MPFFIPFLFFPTITFLSGASCWGMMRVRGLDFHLIGVHLGFPAAMNATILLRCLRHFSASSTDSFSPVQLQSPKCHLSFKVRGGAVEHVRQELSVVLTDCGLFNNLAFFKSPFQSVVNYSPSQLILSVSFGLSFLATIYNQSSGNHPETQTWSSAEVNYCSSSSHVSFYQVNMAYVPRSFTPTSNEDLQ